MSVTRVGPRWLTLFTVAWLAIWTVQLTPVQLLLPLQLDTQNTGGQWLDGVVWSGLVLSAGGVAGIVVAPLAGRLSDRTRSRWGRRRPWAIGGSLLGALALVATGFAQGPLAVGAAWVGVSVGLATASAAFTALIADQLTTQRGVASAAASSAQAVGIVVGVGAVVLLGLGIVESYVVLAAFIAIVGTSTALLLPDPPASAAHEGERRFAASTSTRQSSLREPNFQWLLASRLAVNIGNALGTALLLFFLLYGLGTPANRAEDDLLILIVIYTIFVVIASIIAGQISDRRGYRKLITIVSAVIQACSGIVILLSPSYTTMMIAAAIMGTGYGAYMAVSLAFSTDLLRDPDDHARDLGFVNVSANLGQLIGPLLGAALVAVVGGFWLVFLGATVFSLVGAAMTLKVQTPQPSPAPQTTQR